MSGSINYNQTSSGLHWTVDNGDIFFLRPYSHGNILQITKKRNGTEWGAMNFHEDGSFELTAYNGEEGKGAYSLRGAMDGRLFWRNQNMIFVKESWVSGTSWYRVWSDGYIEQGGVVAKSNTWTAISFHTPFNSAPLQAYYQLALRDASYPNDYNLTTIIDWFSPTSMNVFVKNDNNAFATADGLWYASGF